MKQKLGNTRQLQLNPFHDISTPQSQHNFFFLIIITFDLQSDIKLNKVL